MKLYRMTIEWDEYLGANEWCTRVYYQYVAGNKNLGKTAYNCYKHDERIITITTLTFTCRALWTCLRKTISVQYNQTSYKRGR